MPSFRARLDIIGINPFVYLPEPVLNSLFKKAGKDKGPIPVRGTVNRKKYTQTLVRYQGAWRLYINTTMLPGSPKKIGEEITVSIRYDPSDRSLPFPPPLLKALQKNKPAYKIFTSLTPSRQQEIKRYIASLKTTDSITRNIEKLMAHLEGKTKFAGREKP